MLNKTNVYNTFKVDHCPPKFPSLGANALLMYNIVYNRYFKFRFAQRCHLALVFNVVSVRSLVNFKMFLTFLMLY
jgi:hypothetical protein